MKTKTILFTALFILSISGAFAHALWIETAAIGKKGQQQEVKIFFGEYEGKEIDSAKKWFSNLKDFSIVLTAPDGKTKILKAEADALFYKCIFTPNQDGVYRLSIVHEVADIYENAKIAYYAFADVAIGNSPKINGNYPTNAMLAIKAEKPVFKVNDEISHQVIFNNLLFAKKEITVIDPTNKNLKLETDADGRFIFKPAQKGNYFLEAFNEEKRPGALNNGKPYEKVWHVTTNFTNIP